MLLPPIAPAPGSDPCTLLAQSAWADQLRASGGKWVGTRSLTMNASTAAMPEVSRTRMRSACCPRLVPSPEAGHGTQERDSLRSKLSAHQRSSGRCPGGGLQSGVWHSSCERQMPAGCVSGPNIKSASLWADARKSHALLRRHPDPCCGAPVADAMDKPLTDQELAQQYEQQLAAGVEERRALRSRLKTVRSVPCCSQHFLS